jgi:hypothetical protein
MKFTIDLLSASTLPLWTIECQRSPLDKSGIGLKITKYRFINAEFFEGSNWQGTEKVACMGCIHTS